jgi:hypothetical protein
MQPNICSHIRHFSAVLQRELKFQFNACQSIDDNINSSTSRHQKQLIAESVARCLKGKSARQREDAAVVNQCRKKAKARSRNILKPFQDSFASGEQQVLKSLLTVIDKSENYDVLSKLFGETKISINGHYKPLFPADLLKPEDYSHNVEVSAHEVSCDLNALSTLINTRRPSSAPIYSRHLNKVIKRKITKSVIFDLESLPISDQKRACSALGDALAELALKDFSAEGRSDVSAALTNDALPEDLRIFYEKRSATTFSSIEKRIQAKEVASLKETKLMIHRLAKEYRKINRREASGITARKNINKSQKDECIDQLSCEGGIN